MRVLMLGWELPPHNSGGLGVACLQLAKALADSGADLDFILPYQDDRNYEFMNVKSAFGAKAKPEDFLSVYNSFDFALGNGRRVKFSSDDFYQAFEYAVELAAEGREYDIIHAHDWLTFRAGLRLREKLGLPLVLHVHSIESDRSGGNYGNPLVREVEGMSMHLADRIIAVSEHTKRSIINDYQLPADKIEVVHNSLDPEFFEPLSEDNSYKMLSTLKSQGWQVVANVGRMTIQKGLSNFLGAAAEVVKRCPQTFFLLVGSGELRDELVLRVAELGLADRVIFTGFLRGKQWRDAYAIADLFVMPSVSEPFGLTPLEAAGYGTPSLISKQSGVSEVFVSCLKVDFWDEHEMANKISGALQNNSLRTEMAARAADEYASLSWGKSAEKIMSIYKRLQEEVPVNA